VQCEGHSQALQEGFVLVPMEEREERLQQQEELEEHLQEYLQEHDEEVELTWDSPTHHLPS